MVAVAAWMAVVVVVMSVVTTVFIFFFGITYNFITHMFLDSGSKYSIVTYPLMLTSKYHFLQKVVFL
jgi:hypothetical protein